GSLRARSGASRPGTRIPPVPAVRGSTRRTRCASSSAPELALLDRRRARLGRQPRLLPLSPAHVHLLRRDPVLYQLQSDLGAEVSCRVPAVRHVLLRSIEASVL